MPDVDASVVAALPGWVGRRVVVRHLLSDGRATDVLGTLLEADGQRLVLRRDRLRADEDETARCVDVACADVLLAKPVPPPPVRGRARDRR
jgi:hypothetical protein